MKRFWGRTLSIIINAAFALLFSYLAADYFVQYSDGGSVRKLTVAIFMALGALGLTLESALARHREAYYADDESEEEAK